MEKNDQSKNGDMPRTLNGKPKRSRMMFKRLPWILICIILLFHAWSRWSSVSGLPLENNRDFYHKYFEISLSLMLGKGFHLYSYNPNTWRRSEPVSDDPAVVAVADFFNLKRSSLSSEDIGRFNRSNQSFDKPSGYVYTVPLYIVALLWKLFGVSWSVVFNLHVLISVLACLGIIAAGWRIIGPWGGVLSGLFFTASGLELYMGTWSLRDTAPCWFLAICVGWFFFFVGRRKHWIYSLFFYISLGLISAVGFGWRSDSLLFLPVVVALTIFFPFSSKESAPLRKRLFFGFLTLFSAVLGVYLISKQAPKPKDIGYHIAYYGNSVRANLFQIENSFTSMRADTYTNIVVQAFARANVNSEAELKESAYKMPLYGPKVKKMYFEALMHQSFSYVNHFFLFMKKYGRGLLYFQDLNNIKSRIHFHNVLEKIFKGMGLKIIAVFYAVMVLTGFGGLFLSRRFRLYGVVFTVLMVGYSCVLLLVLPEEKHYSTILPILALVAGCGTVAFFKNARLLFGEKKLYRRAFENMISGTIIAAIFFMGYMGIAAISYPLSSYKNGKTSQVLSRLPQIKNDTGIKFLPISSNCVQVVIPSLCDFGGPFAGLVFSLNSPGSDARLICFQDYYDPLIDGETLHSDIDFLQGLGGIVTTHAVGRASRPSSQEFIVITPAGAGSSEILKNRTVRITVLLEGAGKVTFSHCLNTKAWKLPAISAIRDDFRLKLSQDLPRGATSVRFYNEKRINLGDAVINEFIAQRAYR